jgi:hypothetical protein
MDDNNIKYFGKLVLAYLTIYAAYYAGLYAVYYGTQFIYKFRYGGWRSAFKRSQKENVNMTIKKACKILKIKEKDLKNMSAADLKNVYRKRCMEVHPDKGGSCDAFRQVHEAYAAL